MTAPVSPTPARDDSTPQASSGGPLTPAGFHAFIREPPPKRPTKWQLWLARGGRAALVFIGFSPLIAWALRAAPSLAWLGLPMELWFGAQCHQEPARSLELFGHLVPVCNRCLGIYLGLGLGALSLRPRLKVWPLRIWVGFAAAAMLLDVWTEALGMRPESAWLRVLTGLLLAYPVSSAIVWTLREGSPEPD